MAFLGRVDTQEHLAKRSPNHPFAHAQISFGQTQGPLLNNSSQTTSPEAPNEATPDPMQPAIDAYEKRALEIAMEKDKMEAPK